MDRKKFELWLTEIANWHRPRPPDAGSLTRRRECEQAAQTGPEILELKTCPVPCEWCENTCDSGAAKRWFREEAATGARWRGYCETCKKKYDPVTGQLGSMGFVKQGLRVAAPGRKLGRPARSPAWYQQGPEINAQDPAERRAELLDRLAALKQNK